MKLLDVNVLLYLFHIDFPQHPKVQAKIHHWISNKDAFALDHVAMLGYLRISTNPKIFKQPNKIEDSLRNLDGLLLLSKTAILQPGPAFDHIFKGLCKKHVAKGNQLNDLFLAAIALEQQCELVSADHDFASISGLRWIDPLK